MLNTKTSWGAKDLSIVFVHGNSSAGRVYDYLFDSRLKEYNLLSVELPGHGASKHSDQPSRYYSPEMCKKLLVETINSFGLTKVILFGHSLGGHLAMEIIDRIKNLDGLIIYGAPPVKKPMNIEEAFGTYEYTGSFFMKDVGQDLIQKTVSGLVANTDKSSFIEEDFRKTDPHFREVLANSLDQFEDEHGRIMNTNIAVTLLNGGKDPIYNPSYIAQFSETGHINVRVIPDIGHYPFVEDPGLFADTLNNEINEIMSK